LAYKNDDIYPLTNRKKIITIEIVLSKGVICLCMNMCAWIVVTVSMPWGRWKMPTLPFSARVVRATTHHGCSPCFSRRAVGKLSQAVIPAPVRAAAAEPALPAVT